MGSALVCGKKEPYKTLDPKPTQKQQALEQGGNQANQASQLVPAAGSSQGAPNPGNDLPAVDQQSIISEPSQGAPNPGNDLPAVDQQSILSEPGNAPAWTSRTSSIYTNPEQTITDDDGIHLDLPCRCRQPCCANGGLFIVHERKKYLLPLQKVDVKVQIQGCFATCTLDLIYVNPLPDVSLETSYEFPLDQKTLLSELTAELNGKTIEAQVKDKEKAKEKYEDAIAGGNAALLAERDSDEKKPTMKIRLGNILPQQTMKLKVVLIEQLQIFEGSYAYEIPLSVFPEYPRHMMSAQDAQNLPQYEFNYQVVLTSTQRISNISLPEHAQIASIGSQNQSGTSVEIVGNQRSRILKFYWRTNDMMQPHLLYTKNEETSEIACIAALVPTFEEPSIEEEIKVLHEEEPEMTELTQGSDFHFIFIIDRSGSMSGNGIKQARDALKIFIRSLPLGCTFSIISFGSRHNWMTLFLPERGAGQSKVLPYTEKLQENALESIGKFSANMGGTELLQPLKDAQEVDSAGKQKRIFILTDGAVNNEKAVIQQASAYAESARVFTFGLGFGCDKNLCKKMAQAGRGSCSIVLDGDDLTGKVITALKEAMDLSLEDCQYQWSDNEPVKLNEVFRNQQILSTKVIPEAAFADTTFKFMSSKHPVKKAPISMDFSSADFTLLPEGSAEARNLFKFAIFEKIRQTASLEEKKLLSTKYQVLCSATAMVGVIKQDEKTPLEAREEIVEGYFKQCRYGRQGSDYDSDGSIVLSGQGRPASLHSLNSINSQTSMSNRSNSNSPVRAGNRLLRARRRQSNSSSASSPGNQAFNQRPLLQRRVVASQNSLEDDNDMSIEEQKFMDCRRGNGIEEQKMSSFAPVAKRMLASDSESEYPQLKADDSPPVKAAKSGKKGSNIFKKKMKSTGSAKMNSVQKQSMACKEMALKSKAVKGAAKEAKVKQSSAPKPSFDSVIAAQHSTGYWAGDKLAQFRSFFREEQVDDAQVRQALTDLQETLAQDADIEAIYATLLAIYILQEKFADKQNHWTLLVRKAKAYLKKSGVTKPEKLINQFSLQLVLP